MGVIFSVAPILMMWWCTIAYIWRMFNESQLKFSSKTKEKTESSEGGSNNCTNVCGTPTDTRGRLTMGSSAKNKYNLLQSSNFGCEKLAS